MIDFNLEKIDKEIAEYKKGIPWHQKIFYCLDQWRLAGVLSYLFEQNKKLAAKIKKLESKIK